MIDVSSLSMKSYREWAEFIAPMRGLQAEARGNQTAGVDFVLSHQPAGDHSDAAVDECIFTLGRAGVCHAAADVGFGKQSGQWGPGCLVVTPAETPTDILIDRPHSLLSVGLSRRNIGRALGRVESTRIDFGRSHSFVHRAQLVEQLMLALWDALADPAANPLFIETYTDALIVAVYLHGHGEPPKALKRQSAAKHDFVKLTGYIADNLAEPLTLESLAAVMGLTTMQLAKAFRAQQGQPLHQYVLQQRVTRARELISDRKLTLSDVAYATGFSSQAHMTSTFSKLLGTTPGKLRELAR